MPSASGGRAVIVGGYGQVGREVARALAAAAPGRVTIAGRDGARAAECAAKIRHGAEALQLDARDPGSALDDAAVVVMCVEPPGTELARRCLSRGVHYVDITADASRIEALERLDLVARGARATGVLSVGLAPGVTNLLAALLVRSLPAPPERLDLLVLVGMGEAHGPAAIEWTLGELARENACTRRTRFMLPGCARPVQAFSFGFPEGRTLPRTIGARHATSWFALHPAPLSALLPLVSRLGLARALAHGWLRRAALPLLAGVAIGPDSCTVAARADGRQVSLSGRREATLTGLVAADVARRLLESALAAGVRHVEELVEPLEVLHGLAATDPSIRLDV